MLDTEPVVHASTVQEGCTVLEAQEIPTMGHQQRIRPFVVSSTLQRFTGQSHPIAFLEPIVNTQPDFAHIHHAHLLQQNLFLVQRVQDGQVTYRTINPFNN